MEKPKPSLLTYAIVYVATGIGQTCMFIYLGIMPFLFTEFGVDTVTFGYLMSASAFLQLCSSPLLGHLADSIGSRTVLILCMCSASAAHFVMGIAWSMPVLILSKLLGVVSDCLPVAQMAITDMTPEGDRGHYLSKLMIPMSVALILGPPTSGFLSSFIGSQRTLQLTWILPLVAIVLILMFIPFTKKAKQEPHKDKKSGTDWSKLRSLVTKGDVPFFLTMRFLVALPVMLFMMNFQLAGVTVFNLNAQGLGLLGAGMGIMNLLNGMFIVSWISSKMEPDQLMKVGTLLALVTYFFLTLTTQVWQLAIVLCLVVISYSIVDNHLTAAVSKAVDPNDSSTMLGISTAIFHFCRTLSPTLGGALMQNYGFYTIGAIGTAVSLLAVLLSFLKTEPKTKTA